MKRNKLWLGLVSVGMLWSCGSTETPNATLSAVDEITSTEMKVDKQDPKASKVKSDSLYVELEKLMASESEFESTDERLIGATKTMASLNAGFKDAALKDTSNVKANLGFIVTELATLAEDDDLKDMADSIVSFMESNGGESSVDEMYASGGVLGLGKALAVETPSLLKKMETTKEWPSFVTIGKIQEMSEEKVLPKLKNIEIALKRIESADESFDLSVFEENFDLDLGEIYLLHSFVNLTQAMLYTFSMRDFDLYSPNGKNDYSWINDIMNASSNDTYDYYTTEDGVQYSYDDYTSEADSILAEVIKYNLERASFLSIRKNYGPVAHECLNNVVTNLEKSVSYIRNESDDQSDDILKKSDLLNLDDEMANVYDEMKDDGVSEGLSKNFKSPETLLAFMKNVLNNPFTFDEKIKTYEYDEETGDESAVYVNKKITIDVSKFFLNPVADGKTLLPKFKWRSKNNWYTTESDTNSYTSYYDESTTTYINEWKSFNPIYLVDDKGSEINDNSIFPYFNDYTFGGVFPGMTRSNWINFIE